MADPSNLWWLPTIALVVSTNMVKSTDNKGGFSPCSQSVSTPQEGTTASSGKLKELKP